MITKEIITYQLTAKSHAVDSEGVCWTTHYVMGELARLRGEEYYSVVLRCEEHNQDNRPQSEGEKKGE